MLLRVSATTVESAKRYPLSSGAPLVLALLLAGVAPAAEGRRPPAPREPLASVIPFADPGRLKEALARARAERKLVALIAIRGGEPARDLLALLGDPEVERALQPAIPLYLSADRQPRLAARHGLRRFPVALFLDGAGREAGRISGLPAAAEFARRTAEIAESAGIEAPPVEGKPAVAGPEKELLRLVSSARRTWNAGRRIEAVALFEKAVRALEEAGASGAGAARAAARAHLGLGDHLLESGRPGEARAHYGAALSALQSSPEPPPPDVEAARSRAALGLSLSARAGGRLEEAISSLESALEGLDGAPALAGAGRERALYLLGRVESERGDLDSARDAFRRCAAEFPQGRYGIRAKRYLEPAEGEASPE